MHSNKARDSKSKRKMTMMMMNMTAAMERNLSTLLKEYGKEMTDKLAGKYGFDAEEAWRSLCEVEVKKVKKERKPRAKKETGEAGKPKGRPKKEKTVDVVGETDDLFEELMESKIEIIVANEPVLTEISQEISQETYEAISDLESETNTAEKDAKAAKAEEKAKAKEAEKAAKAAAKAEEKAKAKEAEKLAKAEEKAKAKEAEKAAKAAAKAEEKAKAKADEKSKPKDKKVSVKEPVKEPVKEKEAVKVEEEEEKEDEEEVVNVEKLEFEGVKYYKSKESGLIYNLDEEEVGKWDEKTKKIIFETNDDELEEEE
jgi:hypothetical protein